MSSKKREKLWTATCARPACYNYIELWDRRDSTEDNFSIGVLRDRSNRNGLFVELDAVDLQWLAVKINERLSTASDFAAYDRAVCSRLTRWALSKYFRAVYDIEHMHTLSPHTQRTRLGLAKARLIKELNGALHCATNHVSL